LFLAISVVTPGRSVFAIVVLPREISPTVNAEVVESKRKFSNEAAIEPSTSNVLVGPLVLTPNLVFAISAYKNDTLCTVVVLVVLTK
jgi:hypothetical protein